jgi:beta-galactosidase
MQPQIDPSHVALSCDAMRGLKRRNFWVMEQQAGPSGWETVGLAPRPGELRLWTYQAIAHGADAIVYFRWRTARFGTEKYWHGLLDHHGRPGRRYQEIQRTGAEIEKIGEHVHGSSINPSVAMILSYDSRFAFQIQANNPQFSYSAHFHQVYRALYDRHIPVDIVAPTADLSAYKLVVAPALHLVSQATAENLTRFVEAGGVLIVTPRSGVKDGANTVVNMSLPGLLADLCGVEVEEYDSLPADGCNELEFTLPELASGPTASASVWCDVLEPRGATVVARYTQDYYAGRPAITLNEIGQGRAVYVGTIGDAPLYEALVGWLLDSEGVNPPPSVPEGVQLAARWQGDRRLLFVLNHTDRGQEVTLDGRYANLLDGSAPLEGTVALAPKDVLVLTEA